MDGCAIFYKTSRLQLLGMLSYRWQGVLSGVSYVVFYFYYFAHGIELQRPAGWLVTS